MRDAWCVMCDVDELTDRTGLGWPLISFQSSLIHSTYCDIWPLSEDISCSVQPLMWWFQVCPLEWWYPTWAGVGPLLKWSISLSQDKSKPKMKVWAGALKSKTLGQSVCNACVCLEFGSVSFHLKLQTPNSQTPNSFSLHNFVSLSRPAWLGSV